MELKSTTLKELIDLLPEQLIKSHNKSDRVLTLYNNSSLYYMPLDDAREAVEKIKSLNLGFVAVDQLEEISEDVFLAFVGRLRRQNSERNFFATCNPAGHDWVYRRWKFNNSPDYQLFEAKTTDNPYLPPDYVQNMIDNYPDNWVKRYIYCSWDEFDGLVYSQFIEQKHKIPPYIPAPQEKKYIIADYGYRNPTAVLFAATDYDGVTRIYDEYYEPGKLISEVSDVIKSMPDYRTATKLIDPSTRNRQRDGYSVWDEFARFNPRTHTGCDQRDRWVQVASVSFNPRTHTGCDQNQIINIIFGSVSIHAPTRGATYSDFTIGNLDVVSIHAPTRGATEHPTQKPLKLIVSIHAPTRGATTIYNKRYLVMVVSIHAPTRGATQFL